MDQGFGNFRQLRGRVTCLSVVGKTAVVTGRIEGGDLRRDFDEFVDYFVLQATDNGPPKDGRSPDFVTLNFDAVPV